MPTSATGVPVHNPATGDLVGEVPVASAEAVGAAVRSARRAAARWAALPFRRRSAVLARFHDLLLERAAELLDTLQAETGKTRRDALLEVATVAGELRYYLAHGKRHLAPRRVRAALPGVTSARVFYRPHGVVGLITPWNYPLVLTVGDAVPALLAGNAVVIKPSERTPLSVALGRELMIASGLDADLFGLVNGWADTARALVGCADYVGFTGSCATGRQVAVAAAERLVPYSLELGGKNPMVVLADAPLRQAARGLVNGCFANAGQTCIAVERVYVERAVYDRFRDLVVEATRALRLGWSPSWELDMGSLISREHSDKVMEHIEDAVARGARVLAGGRRREDLGPAFVEPTLLEEVPEEALASRSETFGPVVALYPVSDAEEAVRRANDSEFGLNASVWSGSRTRGIRLARRIETGSTGVNSTLLIYHAFDAPMGGVKGSGLGRRHGPEGIRRFTEAQSIVSSLSVAGGYEGLLGALRSDLVARLLLRALRLWRRLPGLR